MKLRSSLKIKMVLSLLSLAACGGSASEGGDAFIAFQRDFQGFRSWESFDAGNDATTDGGHEAGLRTAYLSRRPAKGSPGFPLGTLIVKTIDPGDGGPGQIFAMAKREGGFNSNGAVG